MKKQIRKLTLHRETLHALDHPIWMRNVAGGGDTMHGACLTTPRACGLTGDNSGSYDTQLICSNGCATGGACTVTCTACSELC
jgi:hypothetical protein